MAAGKTRPGIKQKLGMILLIKIPADRMGPGGCWRAVHAFSTKPEIILANDFEALIKNIELKLKEVFDTEIQYEITVWRKLVQ